MSTITQPGTQNSGHAGYHPPAISPLPGTIRPQSRLRVTKPPIARVAEPGRIAMPQGGFQVSIAEGTLLDELVELGHGCLENVKVEAGVTRETRVLHKAQWQLVLAARQFQAFTKISVRDGLPAWAEVEVESRVARRALKTLKFNDA